MFGRKKHVMDHKPNLLKQASNKQELIHWENILIIKNKDRIIHFDIPAADHLTKSSRKKQINSYKNSKPTAVGQLQ